MREMSVAVIYYSSTGTNFRLAQAAVEAARDAGAEVRLRRVAELAPEAAVEQNPAWKAHLEATRGVPVAGLDDLEWADVLVFTSPTRYGGIAAQMKQFLDSTGALWAKGKLADKVVTAMTSASNPHGGQEATILALYTVAAHWGAIIVPPGYTHPAFFQAGGNPYGTSTTATAGEVDEQALEAARHQALRAIRVAQALKAGRSSAPAAGRKLP